MRTLRIEVEGSDRVHEDEVKILNSESRVGKLLKIQKYLCDECGNPIKSGDPVAEMPEDDFSHSAVICMVCACAGVVIHQGVV